MQEKLKLIQTLIQQLWRRGYEDSIAGTAATNPILAVAELAGLLAAASSLGQQDLVDLSNQTQTQRKA